MHARKHLPFLVALAMSAFAANSLLCRFALKGTTLDAASFTSIRIASGAVALGLIAWRRPGPARARGDWGSAAALFIYAAGFSFAYIHLSAGMGALLLFGAVQATMIGWGLARGEKLRLAQAVGLILALAGLVGILLPGLSAPPVPSALLMLSAGAAWGVYSLRGKGCADPAAATAGNFLRAVPFVLLLSLFTLAHAKLDPAGVLCAVVSGSLASGVGYAVWYAALPSLSATQAATVQLSVPMLAAMGGILVLGEPLTLRLWLGSAGILSGIALVVVSRSKA